MSASLNPPSHIGTVQSLTKVEVNTINMEIRENPQRRRAANILLFNNLLKCVKSGGVSFQKKDKTSNPGKNTCNV